MNKHDDKKLTYVEISVGSLPEWYEEEHDFYLESEIYDWFRRVFPDVYLKIEYNYQENCIVGYNHEDDILFSNTDITFDEFFEKIMDRVLE